MTGNARSDIFTRLRKAASGSSAGRIDLERKALGSAAGPAQAAQEKCQAFLASVLANQGSVDNAADRPAAVKAVADYLYRHFRSHRLVAGNDPRIAAMPWRNAGVLPRFGSLEEGEPVALSYARLGVVETGAVVTFTGKANPGVNNLLPEHHIVLLDTADIIGSLEEAWERINLEMEREGRPRGINFIAGPSSTADIEGQLVYGAHGPRRWHVILLGDVPTAARELVRSSRPEVAEEKRLPGGRP
jgi:L-lactate dehydrogenase complex protein LldG